jgi:hypothetical protein
MLRITIDSAYVILGSINMHKQHTSFARTLSRRIAASAKSLSYCDCDRPSACMLIPQFVPFVRSSNVGTYQASMIGKSSVM